MEFDGLIHMYFTYLTCLLDLLTCREGAAVRVDDRPAIVGGAFDAGHVDLWKAVVPVSK